MVVICFHFIHSDMRFIKRYKARRAKRKEIKDAYKTLTSYRIRKGASLRMGGGGFWDDMIEEQQEEINELEQELCKL